MYSQSLYVVDSLTLYPVPFTAYQGEGFAGFSDGLGLISGLDDGLDIELSHIAYSGISHRIKYSKDYYDTVYLSSRVIEAPSVTVVAKLGNPYDRINLILRNIRSMPKSERMRTGFHRFYSYDAYDEIRELVKKVVKVKSDVQDSWVIIDRSFGLCSVNSKDPYITLDIDAVLASFRDFEVHTGIWTHLLNCKKITYRDFDLSLVGSYPSTDFKTPSSLYKYNGNRAKGHLLVDQKNSRILEHRVCYYLSDELKSINPLNQVAADSLMLHLFYDSDQNVSKVNYTLSSHYLENNNSITTSGFIGFTNDSVPSKIYVPEVIDFGSLYEELLFSPMDSGELYWMEDQASILGLEHVGHIELDEHLESTRIFVDVLDLLRNDNLYEKISWTSDRRLDHNDYTFARPFLDGILRKSLKHQVFWVFRKTVNDAGSTQYVSCPSIWDKGSASVLYKNLKGLYLLTNLTFDIYEVYRRRALYALNTGASKDADSLVFAYYNEATQLVKEMSKVTKYGDQPTNFVAYNDLVDSILGIDNISIFSDALIYSSVADSEYCIGDAYLFFNDYDLAITEYNKELTKGLISDDERKRILYNLALIYSRQGNCPAFESTVRLWQSLRDHAENKIDLSCEHKQEGG